MQAGIIGAPLDAVVTLYAGPELLATLGRLKDELRFAFITSGATLKPLAEKSAQATATEQEDLWVEVVASSDPKCVRCWHHRVTVNQDPRYPEICDRCVINVDPSTEGEERLYV